ncbi:hypothetical protein Tco_0006996 [Tanacetum coccineum]
MLDWRPLCIRRKRHFNLSLIYYASSKKGKKTIKRQPGTGGSSEGTGRIPGVPDESIVISATSSEGTGTKLGVLDKEKVTSEENVILEWGSEQESEYSEEDQGDDEEVDWIDSDEDEEKKDDVDDDKSIHLEMTDDEETEDEFVQGKELVNDNEDEEMSNVEFEDSGKGDAKISDVAKADSEKIKEIKDDAKKAELPLTSSSLSVSSVPHIQSPSVLRVPVSVIFEPSVLALVQETPSVAPVTTLPLPSVSTIPPLRVVKLERDMSELKNIYHSAEALATLKSQVSTVVDNYLGSRLDDSLYKVLQRHTAYLIQKHSEKPTPDSSKIQTPSIELEPKLEKSTSKILKINKEQVEKQNMPQYITKSTNKATLKEYDQKSALYQTMHENKSFNRNPTNHALYHVLMKALIKEENAMDKGVADTVKNHKRQHDDDDDDGDDDDDEDPPIVPNQSKAPSKGSKYGKSATAKDRLIEPNVFKVIMDEMSVSITGREDSCVSMMMIHHKILQNPRRTRLQTKIGSNNLQGLLLLIRN